MNLSRPLMQHGVAVLEKLFETSRTDAKVLVQLEHELKFREVPRARTLLMKVQREMKESELGKSSKPESGSKPPSVEPRTDPPTVSAQPPKTVSNPATRQSGLDLGLDEACRILKVAAGTKWEEIEGSRRAIVQKSYPPRLAKTAESEKVRLVTEARMANQAYEALSAHRTSLGLVATPNNSKVNIDSKGR